MDKKTPTKATKKGSSTEKASPVYRNPFFNFLQEYRKKNAGQPTRDLTQKAAEVWRKMSEDEKAPYKEMAKRAPRRRKGKARSGRRRHRSRSPSSLQTDSS